MERLYILKAIDAALTAGEKILTIYNDPASDFQVERKADNSPLTIADRAAHEVISRMLDETPYPVLSEEGKSLPYDVRSRWESLWMNYRWPHSSKESVSGWVIRTFVLEVSGWKPKHQM